ncbi:MAG: cupredoxin domain-containing protein [Acidimicrobiia bacterium]
MTNQRIPTAVLVLLVPILALMAAIGTRAVKGASTSETAAASTGVPSVTIKNFAFGPAKLTVAQGTKLQVTNADGAAHTFSARNDSFSSPVLDPGTRAAITLSKSGTFAVYCKIHPNMAGTVVVR